MSRGSRREILRLAAAWWLEQGRSRAVGQAKLQGCCQTLRTAEWPYQEKCPPALDEIVKRVPRYAQVLGRIGGGEPKRLDALLPDNPAWMRGMFHPNDRSGNPRRTHDRFKPEDHAVIRATVTA